MIPLRHVIVLAASLFALGVIACRGRGEGRGSAVTQPPTQDAALLASPSAGIAPPQPPSTGSKQPRLELVAIRKTDGAGDGGRLSLSDVGSRVIVSSRVPVAWADGAGPLVSDPILRAGLTTGGPGEPRHLHAVAGTHPGAVYALWGHIPSANGNDIDMHVMHLQADGFRPVPSIFRGLFISQLEPLGDRGVLLFGFDTKDGRVPGDWMRPERLRKSLTPASGPKDESFGAGLTDAAFAATREGHVFAFGTRKAPPALLLEHRHPDGTVTRSTLPGSTSCSSADLRGVTATIIAGGARAFVRLSSVGTPNTLDFQEPRASCGAVESGFYEETSAGLVRTPLLPRTSQWQTESAILAVSAAR